jgi:hypothetical protein
VRSVSRMTPPLAVALAIAGLISIGWVARSTRAQDGLKASAPADKAAEPSPAPTPIPQDSAPSVPREAAPPQGSPATVTDGGAVVVASSPADPANDDPEQNARAFVERNRKEAQDELKKLKEEAERLRTRLGKVEAGIRRWESLLAALERSEQIAPSAIVPPIARDTPTALEPIPAAVPAPRVRESEPNPPKPSDPPTSQPMPPDERAKPVTSSR